MAPLVYVGDTPNDVRAAHPAGAEIVAVATGPHPAAELYDAGAAVVLDSLAAFPAWFGEWLSRSSGSCR